MPVGLLPLEMILTATTREVEDRRQSPTLSDYARSVWRRKGLVVGGLLVGLLLGLLVFPRILPSEPEYEARARLDVRSLAVTTTDGQGDGSGSAGAPLGAGALAPDATAAQAAINRLGPPARQLRVLKRHSQARWATKLAGAVRSSAISDTTQVQVSLADDDPALAEAALQAYLDAYVTRRNAIYDRQVREILNKLNKDAQTLREEVLQWSRQADSERGGSGPSVVTSTRLELAKERYAAKTAQIDDVSKAAALNLTPTRVIDRPTAVPSDDAGNAGVSLALGLLLGIMGGVGLAFLAEAAWPKIVTPGDVHAATGLSVLSSVPRLPRKQLKGSPVVVSDRPFSPAAEGYRRVGTALERQGLGSDIQVLAIVSGDPGDGKSLLAVNLAHSLARQGRAVILVSSDLRQPQVERLLGLQPLPGLAEALQADPPVPAIGLLVSINDHMLVLPAGLPDKHPGELLASKRLVETIRVLREIGIVILDTPPARLSADAMTLSGVADATLLVARSGVTRMRSLLEASVGLRHDQVRQLGVALVGTSNPKFGRRFGYYREQPEAEPEEFEPLEPIPAPTPPQLGPKPMSPTPSAGSEDGYEVTQLKAERNRRAAE
jgi:Mrp family chromosome partitioning ATPase